MNTKDSNKIEDSLKQSQKVGAIVEQAVSHNNQPEGIVKIERAANQSNEEFHTLQEAHNANHALYYFSIITEGIVRGRTTGDDSEKIQRIKEHMMMLREFIGEDKTHLRTVVNVLLERIEKSSCVRRKQFGKFVYNNWLLIRAFSKAYGSENCFPRIKYQRLGDMVFGAYFLKFWWWKLRLQKLLKSSKCFIKSHFPIVNAKQGHLPGLFHAFFSNKMQAVINLLAAPQRKRESAQVVQITNSINDIFHHFCPKDSRLEGLFEELIRILRKCPDLTEEDSQRGINIVEELLKAFDGGASRNSLAGKVDND
mgnify:CR=1 FL=1